MSVEDRAKTEQEAADKLAHNGYKVNFGDAESTHNGFMQVGTVLDSPFNSPAQKKLLSEYMTAIEQPGVQPETLIKAANTLTKEWPSDTPDQTKHMSLNELNHRQNMKESAQLMAQGVGAHFNLDPESGGPNRLSRFIEAITPAHHAAPAPPPKPAQPSGNSGPHELHDTEGDRNGVIHDILTGNASGTPATTTQDVKQAAPAAADVVKKLTNILKR